MVITITAMLSMVVRRVAHTPKKQITPTECEFVGFRTLLAMKYSQTPELQAWHIWSIPAGLSMLIFFSRTFSLDNGANRPMIDRVVITNVGKHITCKHIPCILYTSTHRHIVVWPSLYFQLPFAFTVIAVRVLAIASR